MKKGVIPFFCISPVFISIFFDTKESNYLIIFSIVITSLYAIISLFYVVSVYQKNTHISENFYNRIRSRDFGVNNFFITMMGLFSILIAGAGNIHNNTLLLSVFLFTFLLSRFILFSIWMNSKKMIIKSTSYQ